MLLDGKMVREELLEKYQKIIASEKLDLTLAIIYVGDDGPSAIYINNKIKYCAKVGIKTKLIKMPNDTAEEDVIKVIKDINRDENITGMILQSPVPKQINIENCINYIDPKKDIDGFTKENFYKLAHNLPGLRPCTSKGIIKLLEHYNIDLTGKKVCIIGRGNIVGKPLFFELLNKNATVFMCHSQTKDLKEITLASDIIISAVGKTGLVKENMVKNEAIVIDVGINVVDGKIKGDVDFDSVKDKCAYITPNPGGVGPMTIAMIIENIIEAGRKEVK